MLSRFFLTFRNRELGFSHRIRSEPREDSFIAKMGCQVVMQLFFAKIQQKVPIRNTALAVTVWDLFRLEVEMHANDCDSLLIHGEGFRSF
jgi:hypothetical protein